MRLFDLTPAELAFVVEEAYLADMGDFSTSAARDWDTLDQLRGYLGGRPELAGEVLAMWLEDITGPEAAEMRLEARRWFDAAILGVARPN